MPGEKGAILATLKDLSRHLGLSVTQISRALNGHSDVNEATREKVLAAARQMRYQPNLSARKLATGRSGTVGLVIPAPSHAAGNPLFVQMVSGLSSNFSRLDVRFLLHIAEEHEDPVDVHRKLVDSAALDGFVVADLHVNDPCVQFLQRREIPFVVHGRTGEVVDYPYFDIDNYGVAYRLTSHLTALGHRRIAFLNGVDGRSYCAARTRGYIDALAQAGVRFDPNLHRNGQMRESVGLVETIRLMENPANRPTAFIAGNSLLAKGIYDALDALSLSIPGDVSVVAHDDLLPAPETAAMHPPLTVTEAALQDSWEPMARLLVGALDGQAVDKLQIIGEMRFVERSSTGPVQAG
jgi:LacI family transcriptional regulator